MTEKYNSSRGGNRIRGADALEAHIAKGCQEFRKIQVAKMEGEDAARSGDAASQDAGSDLSASAPSADI